MNRQTLGVVIVMIALGQLPAKAAPLPLGNAFTYQGQLKNNHVPVNPSANFTFSLWDAADDTHCPPAGGMQLGSTITMNGVLVSNGLFTVALNQAGEFGVTAFDGNAHWLQISVNGTTLCPRQPLNLTPYAGRSLAPWITSGNNISYSAGNVGIGLTIPEARLQVSQGNVLLDNNRGVLIKDSSGAQRPVLWLTDSNNVSISNDAGGTIDFLAPSPFPLGGTINLFHISSVFDDGKVGVGIDSPTAKLHVAISGSGGVLVDGNDTGDVRYSIENGGGTHHIFDADSDLHALKIESASTRALVFNTNGPNERMRILSNGNVGIGTTTSNVNAKLEVKSNSSGSTPQLLLTEDQADYARLTLANTGTTRFWTIAGKTAIDPVDGFPDDRLNFYNSDPIGRPGNILTIRYSVDGGRVGIGTETPQAKLDVNGRARVDILEIVGADVAEKFPVSEKVEPGMVVEIDPDKPGQLRLSQGAYNRRVAGVVSGANGLSAGAILGNLPGHEDAPAIALGGRVWVHCDASNGPIVPGDLLTTSDTPGYAMKVTDFAKAQGAIIGKAMSGLNKGETGLLLTLISLQ